MTFIFSGCTYTTYKYVDPVSTSGKWCIQNCQNTKYTCQQIEDKEDKYYEKQYQNNIKIYNKCRSHLNIQNQIKLYKKTKNKYLKQCMKYNNIKSCKKRYGIFIPSKQRCYKPTRYYSNKECSFYYKSCFRGCGGKIIEVEKELF
jgi:hypothetical protein